MTQNDIIRLLRETHSADSEYRVWLLPPTAYATGALFEIGEPVQNMPQPTTLTTAIASGAGTNAAIDIDVVSTALYPLSGMVAITNEFGSVAWFSYTSKSLTSFDGARRVRGHQGTFSAGDDVDTRVLISSTVTSVSISESEEYGSAGQPLVYDWSAQIEGIEFQADFLLEQSVFLVEARFRADGISPGQAWEGWTEWLVMARGYASEGYEIEYDPATGARRWDGAIRSASTYTKRHQVSSRKYGAVKIEGGSVAVSSTLGQPMIVEPEEFELIPPGNAQGGNMVDGDRDTLWISATDPNYTQGGVVLPEPPGYTEGLLRIQELGILSPVGAATLQWIVIVPTHNGAYTDNTIITLKSLEEGYSTIVQPSGVVGWPDEPTDIFVILPEGMRLGSPPFKPALILTNDVGRFTARFGQPPNAHVVDWKTSNDTSGGNNSWPGLNFSLAPTQGGVMLRWRTSNIPVRGFDFVAYGNHAGDQGAIWLPYDVDHFTGPMWGTSNAPADLDPGVTLGPPGTSIRRDPVLTDTNRVGDWIIDPNPNPGDSGIVADDTTVILTVPEFQSEIAETMTLASHPNGSALSITDATPLDIEGYIVIGNERIQYHIDPDNPFDTLILDARDVDATGDTTHTAGTRIFAYVVERNETTAAESIGRVDFVRPDYPTTPDGFPLRMRVGQIWGGDSSAVIGEENWESTWFGGVPLHNIDLPSDAPATTSIALRGYPLDTTSNRRYAQLLRRCFAMSQDDRRDRLNEWVMYRSRSTGVNNSEIGIGAVVRELFEMVLPPEDIAINNGFAWLGEAIDCSILSDNLDAIVRRFCEEALLVIRYTRTGGVALEYAPHHPSYSLWAAPAVTMDTRMLRSQRVTKKPRLGASPVIVNYENASTGEVLSAQYPPYSSGGRPTEVAVRSATGVPLDVELLARCLYLAQNNASHEMRGALTGYGPTLQVGGMCIVPNLTFEEEIRYHAMRISAINRNTNSPTEIIFTEWRDHG
ncbi:MAG: hypothetical protein KDD73_14785 [Anaerolineales bacterium]|nr:hypothetical protein [Anaerolineales bacterium]